jgi:hypothetical protein
MGLLDDAIREHLELKRRRGADPGEVAREQRDALDVASEARPEGSQIDPSGGPQASEADADASAATDEAASEQPQQQALDETAELDMSSVLGEDGLDSAPVSPATAAEQDSLEWEMPGEAAEAEAEEGAEDVLEETPEFLRDTPEEDRLWFEQRPPRDFDFDK